MSGHRKVSGFSLPWPPARRAYASESATRLTQLDYSIMALIAMLIAFIEVSQVWARGVRRKRGFRCRDIERFRVSGVSPAAGQKNGRSNRNRNFWSSVPKSAVVGFRIAHSNRQNVGWVECNETQQSPE